MEPASEKNRRKSLYFHHIVKNKITICYNGAFYSLSLSLSLSLSPLEFSRHHRYRFGGALAREF